MVVTKELTGEKLLSAIEAAGGIKTSGRGIFHIFGDRERKGERAMSTIQRMLLESGYWVVDSVYDENNSYRETFLSPPEEEENVNSITLRFLPDGHWCPPIALMYRDGINFCQYTGSHYVAYGISSAECERMWWSFQDSHNERAYWVPIFLDSPYAKFSR